MSFDNENSEGYKKPKLGSGKRFKGIANKMAREGVNDPKALAAVIGRKKYGNEKMSAMSEKGKSRHAKDMPERKIH